MKIPSRSDPQFAANSPIAAGHEMSGADEEDSLNLQVAQDDFDDPVLDGSARSGAIETNAARPQPGRAKANPRTENFLPLDQANRCRKCGKKTDKRGFCQSCNYSSAPRDKVAGKPIDDIKIKTSGMQLWISNVVSEGVPPGILVVVVHCLFVAFIVAALFVVFTGTGGLMFVAATAFIGAIAFFYGATVWKLWQFRRDPYTQLAWFQRPFWDGVLWYCRKNKWVDAKNPGRFVIDQRQSSLTDQELDKLKDLKNAAVLDLEGTMITDHAFRYFYRMDDLQCLVLKDTAVSHEAVFRLQQTRPKLWVWY